jgi:hypothetical protein
MIRSLLFLFLFISFNGFTQLQLIPYGDVEVHKNGSKLKNAWTGGINSPQFSEIDLNNDGIKDLVVFERNFYGVVKTFINRGNENELSYQYDPYYRYFFPRMSHWMLLRDYNCDGREDIFTSVPAGVAVYRNDSDANSLKFTRVTALLLTEGLNGTTPLYVSPPDIPAITDVDGDGDLDILAFNIIGSTVEYHKNLSVEKYGNCSALEFELKNACWGYFKEDDNNNNITILDTCEVNVSDPEKIARHPGSTILAIDLTGNGAKDVVLGDLNFANLVKLTNTGTPTDAIMTEVDPNFPSNTLPVNLRLFPASYFLDVDNDALKDLLVAPNNPNTSENINSILFYKNQGTPEIPEFVYENNTMLFDEMIDVGERSYPVFFDENSNGLMDIVVGNFGYFDGPGAYQSRLMLLRNTGSSSLPAYEIVTDNYADLGQLNFDGIYPAFGDMDGDGDQDMITGDENGRLHYFRNNGGQGNIPDFKLSQPFFMDIDVGQSAKPQIVDVNKDGLPDLLMGERGGTIKYFENTGTSEAPFFDVQPTVEEFGGIDVMAECCTGYSSPYFTSDSLGNSILYVGSEQGILYLFNNIDNNLNGDFSIVDSLYLHGLNVNVSGDDLTGNGNHEYVMGEFAGGISLLNVGTPPALSIYGFEKPKLKLNIFPNPVVDIIYIKDSRLEHEATFHWRIFDFSGKLVAEKQVFPKGDFLVINVSELESGIYIAQVTLNGEIASGKFFIQR